MSESHGSSHCERSSPGTIHSVDLTASFALGNSTISGNRIGVPLHKNVDLTTDIADIVCSLDAGRRTRLF